MSYYRVIPRDLFNEANHLKCLGKLYIELEKMGLENLLIHSNENEDFTIYQDESGSTICDNVFIRHLILFRPLNSRYAWPLVAQYDDDDSKEFYVFNDDGTLTNVFKSILVSLAK